MDIKKLLTRSVSGLVYVLLIIGCVLWGSTGIAVLGILLAILSTFELEKIIHEARPRRMPLVALDMLGVVLLAVSFNPVIPVVPLVLWILVILARLILELYAKDENPLKSMAHSIFVQIYIGLPLCAMSITSLIVVPKAILLVFLFLWINDTGAYLVGSMVGKHRLFERISPKKSWEGFFGGLVFNLIAASIFCYCSSTFMGLHANIIQWLIFALIVTVFGTWGDLIESMIKRHLNIKDSGNLIPGHGGILDRIDSFLLAMPAVLVFFSFIYLYQ
ncbi:MAG: phosphatidate cytidylyltransferase [Bacteroides sp.]|nr:phosphatidate cytidylyltransferase [Bacteroides sp.]